MKMIKQKKVRYVTGAINEKLNLKMQVSFWELLDSIAIKSDSNSVKIINW